MPTLTRLLQLPLSLPLPLIAASLCCVLAACDKAPNAATAGAGVATAASSASAPGPAGSAPPVGVTTVRAQQRDMPVLITATGTVQPLASVDVRAQTSSIVTQVHVKEGQFVRKGDLLFTLDSRADEANVAKAVAQVARDEAALADARRQLARNRDLLAQGFVSQGALDGVLTNVDAGQALVSADRAAVQAARVALGYARITAPSAGRLGAINVFPGSAVQANTTALVTVTQLDPITVSFALPQRHLPDALAALKNGGADVNAVPPESDGRNDGRNSSPGKNALQGKLKFVDNAVDAGTGTVRVKAQFDNADGRLWPGAFVNVAMTARVLKAAVIVPQAALIQGPRGTFIYVVQDGRAQPRPVQQQYAQGDDTAVSNVKPGERVVLDGRQNLRPGAAVVERSGGRGGAASGAASGGASGARNGASGAGAGGTGTSTSNGNGNGNPASIAKAPAP